MSTTAHDSKDTHMGLRATAGLVSIWQEVSAAVNVAVLCHPEIRESGHQFSSGLCGGVEVTRGQAGELGGFKSREAGGITRGIEGGVMREEGLVIRGGERLVGQGKREEAGWKKKGMDELLEQVVCCVQIHHFICIIFLQELCYKISFFTVIFLFG